MGNKKNRRFETKTESRTMVFMLDPFLTARSLLRTGTKPKINNSELLRKVSLRSTLNEEI